MSTKTHTASHKSTENAAEAKANASSTENAGSTGNDIPKSSLTSGVTSDLPAGEDTGAGNEPNPDPAVEASIGLVRVDGIDFRYVGVAPAREGGKAETPGGVKIGPENSTFTPLSQVPFSNSIRVKDPKSGEFYYPGDGITSWEACEFKGSKLIPAKKAAKA